jgi:hypothetical protein
MGQNSRLINHTMARIKFRKETPPIVILLYREETPPIVDLALIVFFFFIDIGLDAFSTLQQCV